MSDLEYPFEELRLTPNPKEPTRAFGYVDGKAEITVVNGDWSITGFYLSNTHRDGAGFVYVDHATDARLFEVLSDSLYSQFEGHIQERVCDWLDEQREEATGSYRARELV